MTSGWIACTLGEITVQNGLQTGPFGSQLTAGEYTDGKEGVPVVMPKDIENGRVKEDTIARVTEEKANKLPKHRLKKGDILFPRRGELGRIGFTSEKEEGWLCGTGCLRARISERVSAEYLMHFLSLHKVRQWLEENAVGQTMLNLNTSIIADLPLSLPPLAEQKAIADLLTAWDIAIRKTQILIGAKEKRRRALAGHLLFGKVSLQGHDTKWKKKHLKDVTIELWGRNNGQLGPEAVMAVNKFQGLIPMREHVMASSLERYKVVPPKAFAYNPMRINIGSLAMSHHASDVLVSPDYVVFKCLDDRCDPDFLDHYRRSHAWEHYVNVAGNGSVRVRIYYSELARMRLHLPPIEEQRAISQVLNDANREIELTKQKLAALQKQKRGLMQKLLTGKWRVKTG
jgi:type I restriction enzyme, S subunit